MNNRDLIKNSLKNISPSESLTERTINMEHREHNFKLKPVKKIVGIIAAAIAVITTGTAVCAATGILDFDDIFSFANVTADREFGNAVTGSFKDFRYECTDGYIIEPVAISATANKVLLTIDISREDGRKINRSGIDISQYIYGTNIYIDGEMSMEGFSFTRINSPDNSAHELLCYEIETITHNISEETEIRILQPSDLSGNIDADDGKLYYDISFRVISSETAVSSKKMTSESVIINIPFDVETSEEKIDTINIDVTYTDIRIDPSGVYMNGYYTIPEKYYRDNPYNQYCFSENIELKCILADGTEFPVSSNHSGTTFMNETEYTIENYEYNFSGENEAVKVYRDISDVIAVSINGTVIKLS